MSPNSTVSATSASLVAIFQLIEANAWRQLDDEFLTKPRDARAFQKCAALVAKSKSFNGMTILHACARFNPPPVLVSRIIELCPDAPSSQDCLGRTPLHVASGTGASSFVIKVLVEAFPDACMVQDLDGRTPLHMACDDSCELFEDDKRIERQVTPPYNAIRALLSAALDSAVLEDDDGMSAIEYALCSNADLRTVRLLQKSAQKVMLRKHEEERTNKAKLQVSTERGIAVTAKFFLPRRGLLTAPSA